MNDVPLLEPSPRGEDLRECQIFEIDQLTMHDISRVEMELCLTRISDGWSQVEQDLFRTAHHYLSGNQDGNLFTVGEISKIVKIKDPTDRETIIIGIMKGLVAKFRDTLIGNGIVNPDNNKA